MNVLVVLSSLTVTVFPVTLEMTIWLYSGARVAFFFLLPPKAGVAVIKASIVEMATNGV